VAGAALREIAGSLSVNEGAESGADSADGARAGIVSIQAIPTNMTRRIARLSMSVVRRFMDGFSRRIARASTPLSMGARSAVLVPRTRKSSNAVGDPPVILAAMPSEPAIPPKPLPRNLHPPAPRPRLGFPGGKVGFGLFVMTAATLLFFGWVAWGRYGETVRKVFATNSSVAYPSRAAFFESRLAEVEKASASRKFAFASLSIEPRHLKAYRDGDALVLDASDAKDVFAAREAARGIPDFGAPGSSLERLTVRLKMPVDLKAAARLASAIFEEVLDGAPEGMVDMQGKAQSEIHFNDLAEK
jgi:hypothetical protein